MNQIDAYIVNPTSDTVKNEKELHKINPTVYDKLLYTVGLPLHNLFFHCIASWMGY